MAKIIHTKKKKEEALKYLEEFINKYSNDERILRMKDSPHHSSISAYTHSFRVVIRCVKVVNFFHLSVNWEDLLLAALLHDFYLYNFNDLSSFRNGIIHPIKAANNAKELFGVNNHVYKSIKTHMFPLIPWRIPTSREAWIITIADKLVATREVFRGK